MPTKPPDDPARLVSLLPLPDAPPSAPAATATLAPVLAPVEVEASTLDLFSAQLAALQALLQKSFEDKERREGRIREARSAWQAEHFVRGPPQGEATILDLAAYREEGFRAFGVHPSDDATKGRIMCASQAFQEGDVILAEQAFVSVSCAGFASEKVLAGSNFTSLLLARAIWTRGLTAHPAILDMVNLFSKDAALWAEEPALVEWEGLAWAVEERALLAELMGRCRSNSFLFWKGDQMRLALHPLISLLSHSCAPNARFLEEDGWLYVHALAPIAVGQEITAAYASDLSETGDRRAQLHRRFGFWCTCSACLAALLPLAP